MIAVIISTIIGLVNIAFHMRYTPPECTRGKSTILAMDVDWFETGDVIKHDYSGKNFYVIRKLYKKLAWWQGLLNILTFGYAYHVDYKKNSPSYKYKVIEKIC